MIEFLSQTTTIIGVLLFLSAGGAALWSNLSRPKIERRVVATTTVDERPKEEASTPFEDVVPQTQAVPTLSGGELIAEIEKLAAANYATAQSLGRASKSGRANRILSNRSIASFAPPTKAEKQRA
jgi:hypothetical protein